MQHLPAGECRSASHMRQRLVRPLAPVCPAGLLSGDSRWRTRRSTPRRAGPAWPAGHRRDRGGGGREAGMKAAIDAVIPSDLRRLVRIEGVRPDLVLGALLVVVSAWGLVAAPWLIGKAVNDLQQGSTESLFEVSLAVAGAGIVTAVATGGGTWLLGRYAVNAGIRIRRLLCDRLLLASLDLYRTLPPAQLVARATADVEPIKFFVSTGVALVAQSVGT